ncbi:MAG: NAD-dependent dehydratase [Flavobacteriaceae bacterium]|nr:NAD-dependent dehydratase [Flavobacteriaceae bacterium]|tara:strand:- start:1021 stop:1953 length:933 start_codon:yes stop_codon:yes gene_type:complete
MNVLVVGGAGYVGGGIVDKLKPKHNVTVYDSLIYEESYRKDVKFVNGDIRDTDKLLPLLDKSDAVIWLAALVGDGACAINPELTFKINSESVKFLVENFKKRIVFLSTCSVYGAQDGLLDESSSVNPLSEYASSKVQAEEYLEGTNSIIFRLGTLFGISDEFSRIRLDLVVNILVTKALTEGKLTVFGGDQWRPLLHVTDVANAIDHTIEMETTGVFNLHYQNYKIIDIGNLIIEKIPTATIETTPMKFQDARNYQVSSDKLLKETGFKSTIELAKGIEEVYNLISNNRIKNVNHIRYSNQNFLEKYGVT